MTSFALGAALGLLLGLIIAFVLVRSQRATAVVMATEMSERNLQAREWALRSQVEAIMISTEQSMAASLATSGMESATTREVVGAGLEAMNRDLHRVLEKVASLESDRARTYGELNAQLKNAHEETTRLHATTSALSNALSASHSRGQWGERMAQDVLRMAGLVENVNYVRQKGIETRGIPDYTFLLPQDLRLFMDVKFPMAAYLRHLETTGTESDRHKSDFLKDVRARVKELAKRDYARGIDAVDVVLLFIPNESIYAFIQEADASISDEALQSRVVLCSPLTLFAVLSVVRHAVDSFALERTSGEILTLLSEFSKQWDSYTKQFERLGERIDSSQREFEALTGTRRRQLDRALERIDSLRLRRAAGVQMTLEPFAAPPEPFAPQLEPFTE